MADQPLDVLDAHLEETVTVLLKDGTEIEGELAGFDQHMNLVLAADNTTIIRGDNVVSVTT